MKPIEILILSRNRPWSLFQCVASVREWSDIPYHIIIQDHASEEIHYNIIKTLSGNDCTVLRTDTPLSCNEGRRLGLQHLKNDYCVFIDDDIMVERNWLSRLIKPFLRQKNIGAVCGQIVQNFGNSKMSWARGFDGGDVKRLAYGYTGPCDFCGGGATMYRVDAIKSTQFRPEYNGTGEDWDQILQMRENGWQSYCTDVSFFHFHQSDYLQYSQDRWRNSEIMDSAIALYERWGITTVVAEHLQTMIKQGIPLTEKQREIIKRIL